MTTEQPARELRRETPGTNRSTILFLRGNYKPEGAFFTEFFPRIFRISEGIMKKMEVSCPFPLAISMKTMYIIGQL